MLSSEDYADGTVLRWSYSKRAEDYRIWLMRAYVYCSFFFFQAEDGIRDVAVTGVQTCALPISGPRARYSRPAVLRVPGARRAMSRWAAAPGGRAPNPRCGAPRASDPAPVRRDRKSVV